MLSEVLSLKEHNKEEMYDKINSKLWSMLPEEQIKKVFSQYGTDADISPEFLGFVDIYYYLSLIIPKHFTVIDFGCAYNPQCFFFKEHLSFIGVDNFPTLKHVFFTENTSFYHMSIAEFIKCNIHAFDIDKTFGICSYVPDWGGTENIHLVKRHLKNVFTYYPSR